jgi:hypothetical protein
MKGSFLSYTSAFLLAVITVHRILGLKDKEFQSLYHFTIGSPVDDKRILSLAGYPPPGYKPPPPKDSDSYASLL